MIRRVLLFVISMLWAGGLMTAFAQAPKTVTAQDKADIQALVIAYARTLGTCAADEYADLFAPQSGSFDSGFRGHVVGRERLIAMVQSDCFSGEA